MITGGGGSGLTKGHGSGQYQAARSASTNIASSATVTLTLTWPSAFADANYTASVTLIDEDGLGQIGWVNSGGLSATVLSKTASQVQIQAFNQDSLTAHRAHIEVIAIHD